MSRKTRTCNGKRRYHDKDEALRVIRHFGKYSDRAKIPARAYDCADCAGWHVTSQRVQRAA